MRRGFLVLVIFFLTSLCFIRVVPAATVEGNAYKVGEIEHSGITIDLESLPGVPAAGVIGIMILLLSLSLFLFRRKRQAAKLIVFILTATGMGCVAYALAFYSTDTNSAGEWELIDVTPGDYRLEASADGY